MTNRIKESLCREYIETKNPEKTPEEINILISEVSLWKIAFAFILLGIIIFTFGPMIISLLSQYIL